MNKKNMSKIFMIFGISILVIAIIGSTFAYYVWTTVEEDTTKIVTSIGAATVIFDGGSDIENANLRPVSDKSKGIIKTINVKGDTTGLVFNMYLDLITLPDALKEESFRYALYNGETLKKEGNFSSDYLTSNTSTCTENSTTHITLLTNEAISTSNVTYTLYIWIDGANYTNPNTMMNQSFSFKLHANGEGAVLGETLVKKITNLYDKADKTTVTNNSITYNYATSVSLMNDRLGGTTADYNAGNIRYYGADPNNYIDIGDVYEENITINNWETYEFPSSSECYAFFECSNLVSLGVFADEASCIAGLPEFLEQNFGGSSVDDICGTTFIPQGTPKLYRIIGVFKDIQLADGTKQDLVKVISTESIGRYSWDTSDSTINNGGGINEWSQADLMKLLNPGHESETVGGSLWWNSRSGTCYNGSHNATTTCDFTGTGLKNDKIRNMIAEVTWNLGGHDDSLIYPNQVYTYERGTNVISNPSDGVTRTTTWIGKVALMYISDYGYAVDFNICSSGLKDRCNLTGWIIKIKRNPDIWTLNSSSFLSQVFALEVDEPMLYWSFNIYNSFPSFYLNVDTSFLSGDGTKSNPYVVR